MYNGAGVCYASFIVTALTGGSSLSKPLRVAQVCGLYNHRAQLAKQQAASAEGNEAGEGALDSRR